METVWWERLIFLLRNKPETASPYAESSHRISNIQIDNRSDLAKKLKDVLNHRRRFSFSCSDYTFNICCWFKWNTLSSSSKNIFYRNKLYKKGIEKFKEETDCVELIKSIRLLKTLSKTLLSSNQLHLLSLDNSHLL